MPSVPRDPRVALVPVEGRAEGGEEVSAGHVVMVSGGAGSWAASMRVVQTHGLDGFAQLFTDTLGEHADTYRYLIESSAVAVGRPVSDVADLAARATALPPLRPNNADLRRSLLFPLAADTMARLPHLHWIAEGRTIWEVFHDVRYLGNTQADPCSRILKRELADRWITEHYTPETVTVYVGLDWSEPNRFDGDDAATPPRLGLRRRKLPWVYEAPMLEAPYLTKGAINDWGQSLGIETQVLYKRQASHANCAGGCVKAGMGTFARLYYDDPEEFASWEKHEAQLIAELGDVAMLRDRSGGKVRPLPLMQLRQRIEHGQEMDMFDIGGCGCFIDAPDDPTQAAA